MELMQSCKTGYKEIKICRLCGHDDKENVDIFSRNTTFFNNSDDLVNKILTVYPLVLYKGDPLPQHICPKCINNVNTSFHDIQQVLRQQNKWISSTKAQQPEHKYFRIFKAVENSRNATKESLKISLNFEVQDDTRRKLIVLPSKEKSEPNLNANLKRLLASSSQDMQNPNTTKLLLNENVVKNIQTKLESNGFTIKRIKVTPTETTNLNLNNSATDSLDIQTTTSKTCDSTVVCKYCKLKFSDLKILAQHQIIHLKLTANKIFQKHILPKNLRRGRLITIRDSKSIRCLNCWRIFGDNKAILQHWSCGNCDFYCFICGKEFPHSPKMLREHIPAQHDISYRSAMRQFVLNHSDRIQPLPALKMMTMKIPTQSPENKHQITTDVFKKVINYKKSPKTCIKNDDGTITCKICNKVFDNFRSSNSHMRKHKPTIQYGDANYSSSTRIDNYNTQDEYNLMKPTTSEQLDHQRSLTIAPAPTTTATTRLLTKPPRPMYRVITKNGPLAGIRTKIVQKRQDFIANNEQHFNHSKIRVKTMESLGSNTISMMPPETNIDDIIVPELIPVIKSEPTMENETNQNIDNDKFLFNSSVIKSEPNDNFTSVQSKNSWLCFICNESFTTNNDFQLHTIYVHNIH